METPNLLANLQQRKENLTKECAGFHRKEIQLITFFIQQVNLGRSDEINQAKNLLEKIPQGFYRNEWNSEKCNNILAS